MGAGASAAPYEGGDVSDEQVAEFKSGLEKLSDTDKDMIKNLMSYEGNIGEASENDLKSAMSKLSEDERKMIAGMLDTCLTVLVDMPADETGSGTKHPQEKCKEFSAKLADLILNKDEPCDMGPITSFSAWPNEWGSFDDKSPLQMEVDKKARELVSEYEKVMPDTYSAKKTILDNAIKVLEEYKQILKDTQDKMTKEVVAFITERDKDGNGIISKEECTAIGQAMFKTTEEIPEDHPLMGCVGKPIKFMADLIISNSNAVLSNQARVKYATPIVEEKQAEADAVKEVNSLAYYPDLLAKTVELKEYLDSLTKAQFDEALAAHTKSWESIIGVAEIDESKLIFPEDGDSAEAAPETVAEALEAAPEGALEAATEIPEAVAETPTEEKE